MAALTAPELQKTVALDGPDSQKTATICSAEDTSSQFLC
jgi:hypothetical protein